jgi:hypothetical protein
MMHRGGGYAKVTTVTKELPGSVSPGGEKSTLVRELCVFDSHIFELAGFEDLATFQAFHELGVFLAGHNLHPRVLTWLNCAGHFGDLDTAGIKVINPVFLRKPYGLQGRLPEVGGILARLHGLSSAVWGVCAGPFRQTILSRSPTSKWAEREYTTKMTLNR